MASKTNCTKNGKEYYRISKVVGHKINAAGNEVPVRKEFYGESKKEAEEKYREYMAKKSQGLESNKRFSHIPPHIRNNALQKRCSYSNGFGAVRS